MKGNLQKMRCSICMLMVALATSQLNTIRPAFFSPLVRRSLSQSTLQIYVYIYVCVCLHMCLCVCVYIYAYVCVDFIAAVIRTGFLRPSRKSVFLSAYYLFCSPNKLVQNKSVIYTRTNKYLNARDLASCAISKDERC